MNKKNEWRVITLSAVLCIIISVMIFFAGGMFPGQPRVFMFSDMYYQYIHTIHMFIRKLISAQSLDYSFEMGLGMPMAAGYAGCCLSPFNFLFMLIQDVDTAAFVVTVAKLSTAAGTFAFLTTYVLKTDDSAIVLFSAFYALCGYAVNFSSCIILLDGLYTLPILVYCLYNFVYKGKWKLLCITYSYLFITQIITGYMMGVFSGVIFLVMIVLRHGTDWKKYLQKIICFCGCVFISFLLSAAVLMPEIAGILKGTQEDGNNFEGLRRDFCGLLGAFYAGNNVGIYNIFPAVYSGVIVFLLVPLFFVQKNIHRKYKIGVGVILLFLLICTLWGPAYLFMHGFNAPDGYGYRFSYFWTFIVLFASVWGYESIRDIRDYRTILYSSAIIGCLFYGIIFLWQGQLLEEERTLSGLKWTINVFFLLAYGYLLGKQTDIKMTKRILFVLFLFELFVNGYFIVAETKEDGLVRRKTYYDLWQEQAIGAMKVIDQKEKEDSHAFYRVCYQNAPTDNISMLYGYHGLGYFSSIENINIRNTMTELGYASSPRLLMDYGSTPVMRMLLGQRYYVQAADPRGEHPEYYSVSELPETLGLGYMVSDQLSDCDIFESTDPFENQEQLVSTMCGRQVDLYDPINRPLNIQQKGVQVTYTENGFLLTKETDDIGYVNYTIQDDSDKPAYAYFSFWGMSTQDLNSPIILSRIDRGCAFSQSYLTMPHILPLDREENGEYQVSIVMNADSMQSVAYENQYFVVYDEPAKSDVYRDLKQHEYEIEHFTDSEISGQVEVPEDKTLLFTTIPYDENWHVYVDGNEEAIRSVLNETFISVPMEEGRHKVVFEYRNPWKVRGMAGTTAGVLIILVLWILDRKKCMRKR